MRFSEGGFDKSDFFLLVGTFFLAFCPASAGVRCLSSGILVESGLIECKQNDILTLLPICTSSFFRIRPRRASPYRWLPANFQNKILQPIEMLQIWVINDRIQCWISPTKPNRYVKYDIDPWKRNFFKKSKEKGFQIRVLPSKVEGNTLRTLCRIEKGSQQKTKQMLINVQVLFSLLSRRFFSLEDNAFETSRLGALKSHVIRWRLWLATHLLQRGSLMENNGPSRSFAAICWAALEFKFLDSAFQDTCFQDSEVIM